MNTRTLILLLALIAAPAFAQFGEKTEKNTSASVPSLSSAAAQLPGAPKVMDGPVDPKEYIVGPGDIFMANIWTAVPLSFQVPVTPEGSVVVPTVAEVPVAGKTLEEAKRQVLAEIRKKYITGTASFTLFTPRSFTVTVTGAVLNEGPVIVQATQRVDAAVKQANDLQEYKVQSGFTERDPRTVLEWKKRREASGTRNIVVKRKNGTVVKADLDKYLATFNTSYNPLLMDGDIVIVQPRDLTKDYVGIFGAVTKQGNYEFAEGDSLSTLVRIAGGLTPTADASQAALYRSSTDGTPERIPVSVADVLKGTGDRPLQRGDRLNVPGAQFVSRGGTVTVEGEVLRPGSYPIVRDSTTLSQVVQMAGGFTAYASMSLSKVLRPQPATSVLPDTMLLRRGLTSAENEEYIREEIIFQVNDALVQADFAALFEKRDPAADVPLQDGDRIVIAPKVKGIYVFGEVKRPGFVPFTSGMSAGHYLGLAGGVTEHGESGDMRVIKGATKQWLTPDETTLEEGDYLFVPKEPYRSFGYYLGVYSQVFGIVGTVATLFLLITK